MKTFKEYNDSINEWKYNSSSNVYYDKRYNAIDFYNILKNNKDGVLTDCKKDIKDKSFIMMISLGYDSWETAPNDSHYPRVDIYCDDVGFTFRALEVRQSQRVYRIEYVKKIFGQYNIQEIGAEYIDQELFSKVNSSKSKYIRFEYSEENIEKLIELVKKLITKSKNK